MKSAMVNSATVKSATLKSATVKSAMVKSAMVKDATVKRVMMKIGSNNVPVTLTRRDGWLLDARTLKGSICCVVFIKKASRSPRWNDFWRCGA